jgi:hypothetical protein
MAIQNELDISRYQPDTQPVILRVVPELKSSDPALTGKELITGAFGEHPLSITIQAAGIAKSALEDSTEFTLSGKLRPTFRPAIVGQEFLDDARLVREVVNTAPGRHEVEIRETAGKVFSLAESMTGVAPKVLDYIIGQYKANPDINGAMFAETQVRRMALLAIAGKLEIPVPPQPPKPRIGRRGPEDDVWRDKSSSFHEQFAGLAPLEVHEPEAQTELPTSEVVVYLTPRKVPVKA